MISLSIKRVIVKIKRFYYPKCCCCKNTKDNQNAIYFSKRRWICDACLMYIYEIENEPEMEGRASLISKDIWIAEYCYYDEYERIGLFRSEKDAFLSCLAHWKYDYMGMDWYRKSYTKKEDRNMIFEGIKRLGRYDIHPVFIFDTFLNNKYLQSLRGGGEQQ